jgi:hypothetical protein
MAIGTILCDITMFKDEGTRIFGVATAAGITYRRAAQVKFRRRAVRVMTIRADHAILRHRMVRWLRKLHAHIPMAFVTELGHIFATDLLLRAFMQFVTIGTADATHGMTTGIPVGQIESRCCRVTFQTKEGLGRGRKFRELKKFFGVAPILNFGSRHGQTSGSVA